MNYPFSELDLVAAFWFSDITEVPQIEQYREELWFMKVFDPKETNQDPPKIHPAQVAAKIDSTTDPTLLPLGQKLQDTEFLFSPRVSPSWPGHVWNDNLDQKSFNKFNESYLCPPDICLSQRDVTRWKSASRAAQIFREDVTHRNCRFSVSPRNINFSPRCEDWPDLEDVLEVPLLQLGFVLAALVYGGLHALAWFAHFNTSTEQLLWRISACVVMGGLPVAFGLLAPTKLFLNEDWNDEVEFVIKTRLRSIRNPWKKMGIYIILILVLAMAIAYALARAYLVVECFISLSHLPAGVYDVPDWAAYFPSIS